MPRPLSGISSMATRALLNELTALAQVGCGRDLRIESVGGVDAARRVMAGEPFDAVVLAADAIDRLIAAGRVRATSRIDLARSHVAVAVRLGAPALPIDSQAGLRDSVRAARSIGYSTGPSGTALMQLFDRWGIAAELAGRLVQAPAGVPVASLIACGDAEIGFQQFSELKDAEGIQVLGLLPEPVAIVTTFTAGICSASDEPEATRAWLDALCSAAMADIIRRHGMQPA